MEIPAYCNDDNNMHEGLWADHIKRGCLARW